MEGVVCPVCHCRYWRWKIDRVFGVDRKNWDCCMFLCVLECVLENDERQLRDEGEAYYVERLRQHRSDCLD